MSVATGASSPSGTPGPGPSTDLQGLARGGLGNVLGAAMAALGGLGVVLVVTRSLPQEAAGSFFAASSLFLILATVARLGTPTGLVYVISGERARGNRDIERRTLRLALVPAVAVAVVLGLVLALAAPSGARVLGLHTDGAELMLRLLAAFVPLAVVSDVALAATRGIGKMRPTVRVEYLTRTALQLLLVLLAAGTDSVTLVAVGWAAPYLVSSILALRSFLALTRPSGPVRQAERRRFWRFTAPRSAASVIQIVLQRLDILLVAAFLGPQQAAVYTAASRFLVVGQMGNQAVSMAAQPRLRAALSRGDTDGARRIYQTATGWLILLNWPLYLLAMVLADALMRVFGPGYGAGRPVVVLLAAAMLVATACGMVDMVLSMGGRSAWNLGDNVLALGVNVTLNLVLIPAIGILGAAVSWAAAILVNNLLPLAQITRWVGIHPVTRGTVEAAVLAAVSFAALPLLGRVVAGGAALGAVTGAMVGLLVFVAGLVLRRRSLALGALVAALPSPNGRRRVRPSCDADLRATGGRR
jgi:O-antigen/teichoic acid export membrane protein